MASQVQVPRQGEAALTGHTWWRVPQARSREARRGAQLWWVHLRVIFGMHLSRSKRRTWRRSPELEGHLAGTTGEPSRAAISWRDGTSYQPGCPPNRWKSFAWMHIGPPAHWDGSPGSPGRQSRSIGARPEVARRRTVLP